MSFELINLWLSDFVLLFALIYESRNSCRRHFTLVQCEPFEGLSVQYSLMLLSICETA